MSYNIKQTSIKFFAVRGVVNIYLFSTDSLQSVQQKYLCFTGTKTVVTPLMGMTGVFIADSLQFPILIIIIIIIIITQSKFNIFVQTYCSMPENSCGETYRCFTVFFVIFQNK